MMQSSLAPRNSGAYPKEEHLPSTDGLPELAWAIQTAIDPVPIDQANRAAAEEYAVTSKAWQDLGKETAEQSANEAQAKAKEQKIKQKQARETVKQKRLEKTSLKQKAAAELDRKSAQAAKKSKQRANRKAKNPEKATLQWKRWTNNKAWARTRSKIKTRLVGKQRV